MIAFLSFVNLYLKVDRKATKSWKIIIAVIMHYAAVKSIVPYLGVYFPKRGQHAVQ